jgi:hypothetical protein
VPCAFLLGHMAKKQRGRMIDFSAGSVDQLGRCEAVLRTLPLGTLVTQSLLCRAGLRLLADQVPGEFLAAVRRQLADEYARFGLPPDGGDDGPEAGSEEGSQAGAA